MAPGIPNPLDRLAGLPAGIASTLALLPAIAEHTAAMREHTAVLVDVGEAIEKVAGDTEALPQLQEVMADVAKATGVLEPMDGRMAHIEEAMPVLVEVQSHLAKLPEAIERLDGRIDRLSEVLDQLLASLGGLSDGVQSLERGVKPLGRIARRLPGQPDD